MGELSFSRENTFHKLILPDSYIFPRYVGKDLGGKYSDFLNYGSELHLAIFINTVVNEFIVKDTNPNYSSLNGVIYSKDGKEVIAIPDHYSGVLTIPEGVEIWGEEALWADHYCDQPQVRFSQINLPSTLRYIEENSRMWKDYHLDQLHTLNHFADIGVTITIPDSNPYYKIENKHIVKK